MTASARSQTASMPTMCMPSLTCSDVLAVHVNPRRGTQHAGNCANLDACMQQRAPSERHLFYTYHPLHTSSNFLAWRRVRTYRSCQRTPFAGNAGTTTWEARTPPRTQLTGGQFWARGVVARCHTPGGCAPADRSTNTTTRPTQSVGAAPFLALPYMEEPPKVLVCCEL